MIQADAMELEANLRQIMIHIRQKEVSLFTDQFGVLASTSTFLATLGFGAMLMSTNFLERGEASHEYCSDLLGCDTENYGTLFNNEVAILTFYGLSAVSIFCNFAVVFISVTCLIFGPELAIRGAEKEQRRAIRGMYDERRRALILFGVGCATIVMACTALGWLKYPERTAIAMTFIFAVLLVGATYYAAFVLTPLFAYTEDDETSGNNYVPPPPHRSKVSNATRSAPIVVDGIKRHGILTDDATLSIFDLTRDSLIAAIDLTRVTHLKLVGNTGSHFQLIEAPEANAQQHVFSGYNVGETQLWIKAIYGNIPAMFDQDDFDDDGATDSAQRGHLSASKILGDSSRFFGGAGGARRQK